MKLKKLTKRLVALLAMTATFATTIPAFAAGSVQYPTIFGNDAEVNLLYNANVIRYAAGQEPLSANAFMQHAADIRTSELQTLMSQIRPNGTGYETVLSEKGIDIANHNHGEISGRVFENSDAFLSAVIESEDYLPYLISDGFSHIGTSAAVYNNYPYYELLLMGLCDADTLSIWNQKDCYYVPAGSSLDEQYVFFETTCEHGTSYFPLIEELLTNYNPDLYNEEQPVTMNYRGASHTFNVMVYDMTNFTDVQPSRWYYNAVNYVYKHGIMSGQTDAVFGAKDPVTRGQFATILYRMQGSPTTSNQSSFADVPANKYYTKAVNWANEAGIVTGLTPTQFAPDASITREQMAIMMFRYANYLGYDTNARANIYTFNDADRVSSHATNALSWAVADGLISGLDSTTLAPKNTATRAECATIIQRFIEKIM